MIKFRNWAIKHWGHGHRLARVADLAGPNRVGLEAARLFQEQQHLLSEMSVAASNSTVPYLMVVKLINYWSETVITTVITSQYTVQTVVTNRKLRCRPLLGNDHI